MSRGGRDAEGGSETGGTAGQADSGGQSVGGNAGAQAEAGESNGGFGQAGAAPCVPLKDDPMNCGACGNVCGSNECVDGVCATRVFVSSKSYLGNLGGLAGGDAICQGLADAAKLNGKFMAWLGTDVVLLKSRMFHSPAPYRRLDGVLLAQNWKDLTDGVIAAPIIVNEFAKVVNADFAWSGTSTDGGTGGLNCERWLGDSQSLGRVGSVTNRNLWQDAGALNCGQEQARLFCFEVTATP